MQITSLDLTVAGVASAQQLLQWRQQYGGLSTASAGSKASSSKQKLPVNLIAHLASRMPHLSKLKLYYNTIVQVSCNNAAAGLLCGGHGDTLLYSSSSSC